MVIDVYVTIQIYNLGNCRYITILLGLNKRNKVKSYTKTGFKSNYCLANKTKHIFKLWQINVFKSFYVFINVKLIKVK